MALEPENYFVVSAHQGGKHRQPKDILFPDQCLKFHCGEYQKPVIYSTHPRSWKRIEQEGCKLHPLIRQLKPFGLFDYCKLQQNAFCVLSDSGTLSEESAMLGFPAVLIRTSTERPEVLDKGTIIIGGTSTEDMTQAVNLCREMWENREPTVIAPDYVDDNVSVKVVKIIQSYTKIVNNRIWGKL